MATITSIPADVLAVILRFVPRNYYRGESWMQNAMLTCKRFCSVGRGVYLKQMIDESGIIEPRGMSPIIVYFYSEHHWESPEAFKFLMDRYPFTASHFCAKAFVVGLKSMPELALQIMDRSDFDVNYTAALSHPLLKAISVSRNDIAKRILEHPELDTSLIDHSFYINGALDTACRSGNMEMLEILLKDSRFGVKHSSGTDLFDGAIANNHLDIVERLLEEPRMQRHLQDAFSHACMCENAEAMMLIRRDGEILQETMDESLRRSVIHNQRKTFETLKKIMKRKEMDRAMDTWCSLGGFVLKYQNMLDEPRRVTRSMIKRRKLC